MEISKFILDLSFAIMDGLDPELNEDKKIVQQGLRLYRQQLFRSVKFSNNVLSGVVQDVIPVEVHLKLDEDSVCLCSCESEFFCRHGLALFFHVYSKFASVTEWVEDWKEEKNLKLISLEGFLEEDELEAWKIPSSWDDSDVDLSFIEMESDSFGLSEETEVNKTASDSSNSGAELYQTWIKQTDLYIKQRLGNNQFLFPLFMASLGGRVLADLEQKAPIRREEKPFFRLVTNVHLLLKLLQRFDSESRFSPREIWDACSPLVGNIFRNIREASIQLPKPHPFSMDPILEKLKSDIRELLFFESPFQREVLLIYFTLWSKVFPTSWRDDELVFAEQMASRSNPDSPWAVAYAMQHFLKGDVEKSIRILQRAGLHNFIFIFDFMDFAFENVKVIEKLTPFFLANISDFIIRLDPRSRWELIEFSDTFYYHYAHQTGRFDVYELVLVEMMPYSTNYLTDYYLKQNQYRRYIELLEAMKLTEDLIDRDVLRILQKEDPEALLPYYHRLVKEAISRKNRQAYKEAVRSLKKLRTIYKKLKQEDVWDSYFEMILEKTKRLRAFQEECEKGKLIHVESTRN